MNDLVREGLGNWWRVSKDLYCPLHKGKFRAKNCSYRNTHSQSTKECFSPLFYFMIELIITEDSLKCFSLNSWIVCMTFSRNENLTGSKIFLSTALLSPKTSAYELKIKHTELTWAWAICHWDKRFRHLYTSCLSVFQIFFLQIGWGKTGDAIWASSNWKAWIFQIHEHCHLYTLQNLMYFLTE